MCQSAEGFNIFKTNQARQNRMLISLDMMFVEKIAKYMM